MRGREPFADEVRIAPEGLTLVWPPMSPEQQYSGTFIPWSRVADADPDGYPGQVRLDDGRTVFVERNRCADLAAGLAAAAVPVRNRPDVWSDLLEPFLDTEYDEAARLRSEGRLRGWGFTDEEITAIRRRVHDRMTELTAATWEWSGYGHADVLLATATAPAAEYLEIRAWADAIAARAGDG